jgi:hypothetical protein
MKNIVFALAVLFASCSSLGYRWIQPDRVARVDRDCVGSCMYKMPPGTAGTAAYSWINECERLCVDYYLPPAYCYNLDDRVVANRKFCRTRE